MTACGCASRREIAVRRDGTYLITGGIEGFGYEAARWLVAHGAGSIALVGRRGSATPGCEATGRRTRGGGRRRCASMQGDVADRGSLAAILDAIRASQPPLRGVVHAASAIDDGLAADIDLARVGPILHAKLGGAIALDASDPQTTRSNCSCCSRRRRPWWERPARVLYVAANMALEALARRRQAEGRPALAVAWGPIEDAGYLGRTTRDAAMRWRVGSAQDRSRRPRLLRDFPAMIASGLPVVSVRRYELGRGPALSADSRNAVVFGHAAPRRRFRL